MLTHLKMQSVISVCYTMLFCIFIILLIGANTIAEVTSRTSFKAVKLSNGYMEIVEENTCSDNLIRLSCRSLHAFIFIIEAEYQREKTTMCTHSPTKSNQIKSNKSDLSSIYSKNITKKNMTFQLRGNYIQEAIIDLRKSINRKCSGHQHCRFTMAQDHPASIVWPNAYLRLKYACIPDVAVRRYCNLEMRVESGERGYIKSPGYPLYYLGEHLCFWTLMTNPGQRILLNFYDFNLREPEMDGKCADLIRIQDNLDVVFEACGTKIGSRILSNSHRVTLHFISASKIYPARGILLEYKVLSCTEENPSNGSSIPNDTLKARNFQCPGKNITLDSKLPMKIVKCEKSHWNKSIETLAKCIASSATIVKADSDNNRLSSLTGDNINGQGVRIGREGGNSASIKSSTFNMDSAASAMIKESDYVIDVLLPTILMALLFVGNAVIVYLIFQYRKRKLPLAIEREEIALRKTAADVPQV